MYQKVALEGTWKRSPLINSIPGKYQQNYVWCCRNTSKCRMTTHVLLNLWIRLLNIPPNAILFVDLWALTHHDWCQCFSQYSTVSWAKVAHQILDCSLCLYPSAVWDRVHLAQDPGVPGPGWTTEEIFASDVLTVPPQSSRDSARQGFVAVLFLEKKNLGVSKQCSNNVQQRSMHRILLLCTFVSCEGRSEHGIQGCMVACHWRVQFFWDLCHG